MKIIYPVIAFVMMIGIWGIPAEAASLFDTSAGGPKILIGEIQSYGDYELKAEYFDDFADKLSRQLQANKLMLAFRGNKNLTNESGRHDGADTDTEDVRLSEIHMDAIVRGHQYERGFAAAKLIRYGDATLGRRHFFDTEKIEAWRKQPDVTYHLTPERQTEAQAIADRYGARYLLFCSIDDVDVRLKHTMFASRTDKESRGKKIRASLEYYIVNTQTGKVYEGHCENKKTSQMLNFAVAKFGKGMQVENMLNEIMDAQVMDIANDLTKKGMQAVQ